MAFDIEQWYNSINKGDVLIVYKGEISSEIITSLLNNVEVNLELRNELPKIRKKLYNVVVESLQNLFHHAISPKDFKKSYGQNFGIFCLQKANNMYRILSGNFVDKETVQYLKDRIDQINILSSDELKELYMSVLNRQEFSDKGGGGLGMIDIARRCGNKLNYNFNKFANNYFFFCLEVTV
jgi:hypothetical protein